MTKGLQAWLKSADDGSDLFKAFKARLEGNSNDAAIKPEDYPERLKIFEAAYTVGRSCEEKDYAEALKCFYFAAETLNGIPLSSCLWPTLEIRSWILYTHMTHEDYRIKEDFVHKTFIITHHPNVRSTLNPTESRKLAVCRVRCAFILVQLGNMSKALLCTHIAKEQDRSFEVPEMVISRIREVIISRVNDGYFPPMNGLYRTVADVIGECTVCSKPVCLGHECIHVNACSHTFHRSCFLGSLSVQLRPVIENYLQRGKAAAPAGLKLECPTQDCGHNIDHSSMTEDQCRAYIANEMAHDIGQSELYMPLYMELLCSQGTIRAFKDFIDGVVSWT
jgi:hypothetical protein